MNSVQRICAAAVLALMGASAATAATQSLGVVTEAGKSFSSTVSSAGSFTDYYTFSLGSTSGGATGKVMDSAASFFYSGVDITSLALRVLGGSTILSTDTSPENFTFSGLTTGVVYQLAVTGVGLPDSSVFKFNGTYQGNIKAVAAPVASPAPEASDLALTALGLAGVAFWARRRQA